MPITGLSSISDLTDTSSTGSIGTIEYVSSSEIDVASVSSPTVDEITDYCLSNNISSCFLKYRFDTYAYIYYVDPLQNVLLLQVNSDDTPIFGEYIEEIGSTTPHSGFALTVHDGYIYQVAYSLLAYQYDLDTNELVNTIDISTYIASKVEGVTYFNGSFYCTDTTSTTLKIFSTSWEYEGILTLSGDLPSTVNWKSLCTDGTYLYAYNYTGSGVYRIASDGVTDLVHEGLSTTCGIGELNGNLSYYDGNFYWATYYSDGFCYRLDSEFNYTEGDRFDTSGEHTYVHAACADENYIYISGYDPSSISKYGRG
jgi:hypothetical protein